MIAIKFDNGSKDIVLEAEFKNCVFIGYHHAIVSCKRNTKLTIEDSMFKK